MTPPRIFCIRRSTHRSSRSCAEDRPRGTTSGGGTSSAVRTSRVRGYAGRCIRSAVISRPTGAGSPISHSSPAPPGTLVGPSSRSAGSPGSRRSPRGRLAARGRWGCASSVIRSSGPSTTRASGTSGRSDAGSACGPTPTCRSRSNALAGGPNRLTRHRVARPIRGRSVGARASRWRRGGPAATASCSVSEARTRRSGSRCRANAGRSSTRSATALRGIGSKTSDGPTGTRRAACSSRRRTAGSRSVTVTPRRCTSSTRWT